MKLAVKDKFQKFSEEPELENIETSFKELADISVETNIPISRFT